MVPLIPKRNVSSPVRLNGFSVNGAADFSERLGENPSHISHPGSHGHPLSWASSTDVIYNWCFVFFNNLNV